MARSRRSEDEGAEPGRTPSFEQALADLEAVVVRLESGDMPLEQALEAFENGVKLSRQCAATLDAAERRIEILVAERGGSVRLEPFRDERLRSDESDTDGFAADGDESLDREVD